MSEEIKLKISASKTGVKNGPPSLETRKKISAGRIRFVANNPPQIPWNKGKQHPKVSGCNNRFWKGGITPINAKIRTSLEYKIWRRAVFERDNYTCVWCGAKNGVGEKVIIHADHIKPFAYFPELRFAIDNGRTLCIDCHKTTESYLKVIRVDVQKKPELTQ